jgi:hypothetical protein
MVLARDHSVRGGLTGARGGGGRDGEDVLLMEERHVGGGTLRVEAIPFRRVSRWPKAVARDRGGNLRTSLGVSRGIPWIYPRERARRKVEIDGEPKQRCRYETKRARGRD